MNVWHSYHRINIKIRQRRAQDIKEGKSNKLKATTVTLTLHLEIALDIIWWTLNVINGNLV